MPRQDVPYGGTICRLRERIAEIWDKLGEKLHSINGVEGDGQGNVLIRSDSAALTITDDQLQHEIVLDLDISQLPAADVSSVNGQTGAVALTADDIPSDNGDVQTDLDNLEAADTTLQGNINAEALARQNADSTLQTNINALSASIPTAVMNTIAADNTLVRTSGNQNIADVKTVATEATGQYSQQIANSQKVRNEIANLAIMQTGNQTKTGNLLMYNNLNKRLIQDWSVLPGSNTAIAYNFGYDDSTNRINVNQVYAGTDGGVQQELIIYDHDSTANVRLIFGFRGVTKKAFLALRGADGISHIIYQEP